MKKIDVGLIGCGGIANLHLRVLKSMENVQIKGVCDLNIDRAREISQRFGIEKVFTGYDDLLDLGLDLVDVCTPVSTHAKIACDVAKHVPSILVEKPMAISTSECDEMIKTTKKLGVQLCIGHNQLFFPSIEKATDLVKSGVYDIVSFRTSQKESFELLKAYGLASDWMVTPQQRGIIWEVCCHLAYLQLHFLEDIREVYAVGRKTRYPVYDNFAVLLRTKTDKFGMIELSWISKETEIIYEIGDSRGKRIQIYRDFDYLFENSTLPPHTIRGIGAGVITDQKRIFQKWGKFGLNYLRKRKMIPHLKLIGSYISSIQNDLPPPVLPEDGRNAVHLLECIEKSLIEGGPVEVRLEKVRLT
jgi:predicted dehydrogenase